jgi:hypothetical protein
MRSGGILSRSAGVRARRRNPEALFAEGYAFALALAPEIDPGFSPDTTWLLHSTTRKCRASFRREAGGARLQPCHHCSQTDRGFSP